MTRLLTAAFLLILAALLAALAVILARPRWDVGKSDTNRHDAGLFPTPRPFDAWCRRCQSIGHRTAWHEWSRSTSTGSRPSVASGADNGTGIDPRLMGV